MLIAFALMFGMLFIGMVVINLISDELESEDEIDQETRDVIERLKKEFINNNESLLILIIFVGASLLILTILGKSIKQHDNNSDIIGDDIFPIVKQVKNKTREDAVTILKRRFANGEISSFEYTERMSRL